MAGCAAASKLTDGLKRLSQSHAHRNARLLRLKCQWRKDVLDADRADSEVLVLAHRLIGACQLYLGNFGETRRHCEAGLRLGAHWRWHAARGPAGSSCAQPAISPKIGRAHVCTQVTNAHLVVNLLLEKKKKINR